LVQALSRHRFGNGKPRKFEATGAEAHEEKQ